MINVSNAFKAAAQAPVKVIRARVIVSPDTEEAVTISSEDNLISLAIETTGEMFNSVMSMATIKLIGTIWNLTNKPIKIEVDLQNGSSWETIDYGYYRVDSQPATLDKESTTVKAYSTMAELQNTRYEVGSITYPITVANLAAAIAIRFGLTLSDMTALPNASYEIQEDLYANITDMNFRNILAEIAGATAAIASVNPATKQIVFRPLQTTSQETLTYSNLKSAKVDGKYGPVNSVVIARTPQEDNIAVKDDESIAANGLTEVKLANNEIMDDERELFAQPILNAVDGFFYYGFEVSTEGHGWYEIGDRITITDGTNSWEGMVTHINLSFDGGFKEILKGVIPTATTTNYALAGGITKTIHDTQIKVDKQNQQITSIVSEQSQMQEQINNNYTQITQTISEVVTSVQQAGGSNLIKNSAMYAKDSNGVPINWNVTGSGTLTTLPSADAASHGSISAQIITLVNKTISQEITVKADDDSVPEDSKTYYAFSCLIMKSSVGSGSITITDGITSRQISLDNGETAHYKSYSIDEILPKSNTLTITVTGSSDSDFTVSDMMLSTGKNKTAWQQANGEFANTQVQIDVGGMKVNQNNLNGTYTQITPQGVYAYSNNQQKSSLTNEIVKAPTASFTKEIDMPPIKIVPQSDGWAFVELVS